MNIQDILNNFSKSEVAAARGDILVTIRNRKIIYEYNTKGEIINTFKSIECLRNMGIRIDRKKNSILTRDGRIFSYNKGFPNFDSWYKKRKNQTSHSILQYTTDGEFIKEWENLLDVENQLGISRANIRRYMRQGGINKFGKLRTVGGYVWKNKI
jgi:hypothetical protein